MADSSGSMLLPDPGLVFDLQTPSGPRRGLLSSGHCAKLAPPPPRLPVPPRDAGPLAHARLAPLADSLHRVISALRQVPRPARQFMRRKMAQASVRADYNSSVCSGRSRMRPWRRPGVLAATTGCRWVTSDDFVDTADIGASQPGVRHPGHQPRLCAAAAPWLEGGQGAGPQ